MYLINTMVWYWLFGYICMWCWLVIPYFIGRHMYMYWWLIISYYMLLVRYSGYIACYIYMYKKHVFIKVVKLIVYIFMNFDLYKQSIMKCDCAPFFLQKDVTCMRFKKNSSFRFCEKPSIVIDWYHLGFSSISIFYFRFL